MEYLRPIAGLRNSGLAVATRETRESNHVGGGRRNCNCGRYHHHHRHRICHHHRRHYGGGGRCRYHFGVIIVLVNEP